MLNGNIAALLYLTAGVLFILALRGLSSPETARQGNRFGVIGMAIAAATTLLYQLPSGILVVLLWVLLAIGIGGSIGVWRARTIQMTAMPQLVALVPCSDRPCGCACRSERALCAAGLRSRHSR